MHATKNRGSSGKLYSRDTACFKSSRRIQGRLVAGTKNNLLARDWMLVSGRFFKKFLNFEIGMLV